MTAPAPDAPARRDAPVEEWAGVRWYYRLEGDPAEQHFDWPIGTGIGIAQAMAVKTATVTKVHVGRLVAVLNYGQEVFWDDPEALQALIWVARRFHMGESDLPITALSGIDLLSVRQEQIDAQGVELDIVDPDPDPAQQQLAADIAADLMHRLPTLELAQALLTAATVIRLVPDPEEAPGEDPAGDEPAAAPVKAAPRKRTARKATTPRTSKRS